MATTEPRLTQAEEKAGELQERHQADERVLDGIEEQLNKTPDLSRLRELKTLAEGIRLQALDDASETLPKPPANANPDTVADRRNQEKQLQNQAGTRSDRAMAVRSRIEVLIHDLENADTRINPPPPGTPPLDPPVTPQEDELRIREEERERHRRYAFRDRRYWSNEADRRNGLVLFLLGLIVMALIWWFYEAVIEPSSPRVGAVVTHTDTVNHTVTNTQTVTTEGTGTVTTGPTTTPGVTMIAAPGLETFVPPGAGGPIDAKGIQEILFKGKPNVDLPMSVVNGWIWMPRIQSDDLNTMCRDRPATAGQSITPRMRGSNQIACYRPFGPGEETLTVAGVPIGIHVK